MLGSQNTGNISRILRHRYRDVRGLDYDHSTDTLYVRDAQNLDKVVLSVRPFCSSDKTWATAGSSNVQCTSSLEAIYEAKVMTHLSLLT